ncbi:MAG: Cd(II)/Pb(II)-responsive transcriptional regulator [Steroidobacteraceae bacterium]
MTIGALARRMQCPAETIRFYEREGLLPPPARSGGNYRLYGKPHLERLAFIRRCRSLDMTLDEIRVLLQLRDKPADNCAEVNGVLDEHIQHVADRIADLRTLQTQLRDLRQLCVSAGAEGCGILKELARGTEVPRAPGAARHVRGSHSHRSR